MSGTRWFVQLHLDLPASLTLQEAHDLCEAAEFAIRAEFPRAEVLVHADPQH
jgi:divalent metal cation (Fe/Co/Zn/Cd) transporter